MVRATNINWLSREGSLQDRDVLDIAEEVHAPVAAFAADAGVARAAEGRGEITDEEAIDPETAGNELVGDPPGTLLVAAEQHGGEAVFRAVGDLDQLGLVVE